MDRSEFGERCPICLGQTAVVAEAEAEREENVRAQGLSTRAGLQALLDNVRSTWNVGSIFRSAEGFGFAHLYLCGITPTPENEQLKKTALGAQDIVPWSAHRNAVTLLTTLKKRGHRIWALERTARSTRIETAVTDERLPKGLLLVVGNEQTGIDPGILHRADRIVHIEMQGHKRSFNVSIAFALAAHTMSDHR
jgi:tRNA G18 (ribose-2'-O)-methylase SpoU